MSFLALFTQSPEAALLFLIAIVAAITIHEFAHAWTADYLGDDTPRLQGRVSLNPLAHLDPIGSIAFILLGFGWGKPVLYNPMRLHRQVDELLIALAGPASNLAFAFLLNVAAVIVGRFTGGSTDLLELAASINVLLAAFNMLPIPPLDGSSIVAYFWPEYRSYMGGQIGMAILLILIFMSVPGQGNLISVIIQPITAFFDALTRLFGLLPL